MRSFAYLAFISAALATPNLQTPPNTDLTLPTTNFESVLRLQDDYLSNDAQANTTITDSNNGQDPKPPTSPNSPAELVIRDQGACSNGFNSCSTLAAAFAAVCCPTSAACSTDAVGNVACCPYGASCTGTISPNTGSSPTNNAASPTGAAATTTAAGGGGGGGAGAGVIVIGATTTSSLGLVVTAAPSLTANPAGISYVPNAIFPFPIISTTFSNQALCLSAYSACTSNYGLCTANLAGLGGAGYGVTIVAPGGGGVTVAAATTNSVLPAASAASVCSSLSGVACHGIQSTDCGVAPAAGTGVAVAGAAAERVKAGGSWGALVVFVVAGVVVW